ncbi:MAG TPA: prepilin-type N-terminal cleavage/methylation domain-containing protein [Acidimicrobiales bacterium]|nr:prepilin-type N-terminal cleavage/methylation domain-containing protein [Acidimicrobiales bacterium]
MTQTRARRRRRKATATPGHAPCPVRRPPRRGEEGFTLIELLIVLVIIPLVMGAVATVLITSFENQQGLQTKLSDSSDATVTTEFYVRDVESATAVTTTSAPQSRAFVCGQNGTGLEPGSTNFLLGLELDGGATVSYYEWSPSAASWPPAPALETDLVRIFCSGTTGTPGRTVLSHSVTATAVAPTVSCITPIPQGVPSGSTCQPATDWTPSYLLSNVSLGVTQGCPSPPGPPCASDVFTATAVPRLGIPVQAASAPSGPLTLLNTAGADITFSGFALDTSVCVGGTVALDTKPASLPAATDAGLSFADSVSSMSSCTASHPTSGAIAVANCAGASGAPCPAGTFSGVAASPQPTSGPAFSDPLATTASANPIPPVTTPGACTHTMSGERCTAGVYSGPFTVPGASPASPYTVTFQPGDYQFDGQVTIGDFDKVFFGNGDYTFDNGVVTGGGDLVCGVVSADSNCPAGGGVFFWVAGGAASFGSGGVADEIDLAAPQSGQQYGQGYVGDLLWQPSLADSQPVVLSGPSVGSTNAFEGVIYAPGASVDLDGTSDTVQVKAIVAFSLECVNSIAATMDIG